jgi:uncharacterized protein (TIGR02246 family)
VTADEQVIEGILQQIETAWNRYDSVSLAAVFAEDANFIQIFGGQLDGRRAIEGRTGTSSRRSTEAAMPPSRYGAVAFCGPMSPSSSPEHT